MQNDKVIFRTPEVPKNRRRKSFPYKLENEQATASPQLPGLRSVYESQTMTTYRYRNLSCITVAF